MRKSAPEFDDPRSYSPGYYPKMPTSSQRVSQLPGDPPPDPPARFPEASLPSSAPGPARRRRGRPAFREVVEHTIGVSREVHERLISMKSRDSEALEDVMRRLLIMPPRTML